MIRPAGPQDLPAIERISHATGQSGDASGADAGYVRFLLSAGTVLVAYDEHTACNDRADVIGWGAIKPWRGRSMLADLFVDPDHQGRGTGARLLRELWPGGPSRGARFTFSSQHAAALPLYVRSGLIPGWPLLYLRGDPERLLRVELCGREGITVHRVDTAAAAGCDAELAPSSAAAIAVDRDRSGVVADYGRWTQGRTSAGLIVCDGGRPVAAGATTTGALMHLTCPERRHAAAALVAALITVEASEVSLCLPAPHPAVRDLLEAGFRIDDHDLSMSTPDVTLPTTWAYSPGLG